MEDIIFDVQTKIKILKNIEGDSHLIHHLVDCQGMEKSNRDVTMQRFPWPKPNHTPRVLTSDGSLKLARADYGGLLRNGFREDVFGYAGLVEVKNIVWVELHALWRGLVLTRERSIDNITIQMDSKIVVDILNGTVKCPWRVLCLASRIGRLLDEFQRYHIMHVWTEANQPADFLGG